MSTKMVLVTKENGKMIFNMDSVRKSGQTIVSMKVITLKAKSTVKDCTYGKMGRCITETGMKTVLKVMVSTNGKMAARTLESGKTTTCMEREFTLGLTEGDMMANMKWTRNMVMEYIVGQMDGFTKEIGSMGNNTELANIFYKMELSK